jgi:hypothetical protein
MDNYSFAVQRYRGIRAVMCADVPVEADVQSQHRSLVAIRSVLSATLTLGLLPTCS